MNKIILLFVLVAASGCTMDSSSQDGSFQDSQRKALADPMNYTPDMSNTDVMGGGAANFDKKAFQHDVDDTLGR